MSPQGPRHAAVVGALVRAFASRPELLRVQMPLAADERSEPDLALVEHHDADAHPRTALLVVEVAVTSRAEDEHKAVVYARAGVPTYWLVDVEDRAVVVFTGPGSRGYAERRTRRGDDALEPPVGDAPASVGALFAAARLP